MANIFQEHAQKYMNAQLQKTIDPRPHEKALEQILKKVLEKRKTQQNIDYFVNIIRKTTNMEVWSRMVALDSSFEQFQTGVFHKLKVIFS